MFNIDKFKKEIEISKKLLSEKDDFSNADKQRLKNVIFNQLEKPNLIQTETPVKRFWLFRETTFKYAVSVFLGVTLMGGTAFASGGSLPGDALYPVKRLKEKVELSLTFSTESKAVLKEKFAEERIQELEKIEPLNFADDDLPKDGTVKTRTEARVEAKAAVESALASLEAIKQQKLLEGKAEAASKIEEKIKRLRNNAADKKITEEKIKLPESKLKIRNSKDGSNFKGKIQGEGAIKIDNDGKAVDSNVKSETRIQGSNSELQKGENLEKTQPQDTSELQGRRSDTSGSDDDEDDTRDGLDINNWLNRDFDR